MTIMEALGGHGGQTIAEVLGGQPGDTISDVILEKGYTPIETAETPTVDPVEEEPTVEG